MFNLRDLIGDRGEHVALYRLTQSHIFMATIIGGKCPAFDILLEVNNENKPYFAVVQVKSSDSATYTKSGRMQTPVPNAHLADLWKLPVPTYIAGVDMAQETVFIAPAYKMKGAIYGGSIPNAYILQPTNLTVSRLNLEKLRDDIVAYWDNYNIPIYKNYYTSLL